MSRSTYRMGEVAADLGVSTSTVKRWVASGQLPHYRVGGVVLIKPDSVERFLEAHSEGNEPSPRHRVRTTRRAAPSRSTDSTPHTPAR